MKFSIGRKYTDYGKPVPICLVLLGPLMFLFATYYLLRIFSLLPDAFEYFDPAKSYIVFLLMLVFFVIYVNYLLTIFWLTSGNRMAWGGMMRQSLLYIIILILNELGIDAMNGDPFGIGTIAMLTILVFALLLLCTKTVRDFYAPPYSEPRPLSKWLLYILWIDPFAYGRVKIE